jgi:hypothetical protein
MTEEQKMLQRASSDIKFLRQQNSILQGKMQMFDDIMLLVKANRNYGESFTPPGVEYDIDKYLSVTAAKVELTEAEQKLVASLKKQMELSSKD